MKRIWVVVAAGVVTAAGFGYVGVRYARYERQVALLHASFEARALPGTWRLTTPDMLAAGAKHLATYGPGGIVGDQLEQIADAVARTAALPTEVTFRPDGTARLVRGGEAAEGRWRVRPIRTGFWVRWPGVLAFVVEVDAPIPFPAVRIHGGYCISCRSAMHEFCPVGEANIPDNPVRYVRAGWAAGSCPNGTRLLPAPRMDRLRVASPPAAPAAAPPPPPTGPAGVWEVSREKSFPRMYAAAVGPSAAAQKARAECNSQRGQLAALSGNRDQPGYEVQMRETIGYLLDTVRVRIELRGDGTYQDSIGRVDAEPVVRSGQWTEAGGVVTLTPNAGEPRPLEFRDGSLMMPEDMYSGFVFVRQ